MSFLVDVAAGLVASAISATVGYSFSGGRRPRLPKFLGSFPLTETRTTAAGILGITLSAGIGLSTSDHSHRMLSYILWYGIALAALSVVIVCTVLDRRRSRSESNELTVPQQSPSLPMSQRQAGILAAAPTTSISEIRRKAAAKAIETGAREREQRDRLKAEIKEELAEDSRAKPVEQATDQLAGAIRSGQYLRDANSPVLERQWRDHTASLVGKLFGALEEARLGKDDDTTARLVRLDELAARVQSGSISELHPSGDWDFYVFLMREISGLLAMNKGSGDHIRDDFFKGSDLGNEPMVNAWISDLGETWRHAPELREAVQSPWRPGTGFGYEGLDQQQSDLVGKLDHTLRPLGEFLPVLADYVAALGEPYGDYGSPSGADEDHDTSDEGNRNEPAPTGLASKLGRFYTDGRMLRQLVKPEDSDVNMLHALTIGQTFKYPQVSKALEDRARQWNEQVRNQLALSAPQFIPAWEKCVALPNRSVSFSMLRLTADGPALLVFLDARLGLLENILGEIRASMRSVAEPAA